MDPIAKDVPQIPWQVIKRDEEVKDIQQELGKAETGDCSCSGNE